MFLHVLETSGSNGRKNKNKTKFNQKLPLFEMTKGVKKGWGSFSLILDIITSWKLMQN